jgi:hypothetical protein
MIDNHIEITHALARYKTLMPEGDYARVLVDNPRSNRSEPDYLRISVARKGFAFNVIEKARELGLSVADVWQYDDDKENDRINLKLEQ